METTYLRIHHMSIISWLDGLYVDLLGINRKESS